jgi:MtaA/CmuA family methyltransferase
MNGKQRIEAALSGRWPDRTPTCLHNFAMAAREAGISMTQFRDDPRLMAKAFGEAAERYRIDCISFSVDTVTLAGVLGVPIDFPEDGPARTHGVRLHSLEQVRDLEPCDPTRHPRFQVQIEAVSILARDYGKEISVRVNCDQAPFSLAGLLRGLDQWLIDVAAGEDDELVHALLDYCTQAGCRAIDAMVRAGAHVVDSGDSPAGPDMLSPRFYGKYALPYEKRLAQHARELGVPYIVHICGKTDRIIHQMAEIGCDGLEIDYKTNIQLAHDTLKDKVTFFGNIDPSGVLALGTPALVEQKTRELLDAFSDTPRFVLNSGCALPADTPEENVRAMLRCVRELH